MTDLFLDYPFLALSLLLVALFCCVEVGVRRGRRTHADAAHAIPSDVAGALLAMLGLLLGFTVSMAEARFSARKHLVIEEANAIGTAALRTGLLPPPLGAESKALFVRYAALRVRWGEQAGDAASQAKLTREGEAIQTELWGLATEAARQAPSATTSSYVVALNEMIDLAAERGYTRANRVPPTVIYLLAVICLIATYAHAVSVGHGGRRSMPLHGLAFATWLVFVLIVDLDQPRRGWIKVSQEPLIQVQQSLEAD
jgi:hypothetical protein